VYIPGENDKWVPPSSEMEERQDYQAILIGTDEVVLHGRLKMGQSGKMLDAKICLITLTQRQLNGEAVEELPCQDLPEEKRVLGRGNGLYFVDASDIMFTPWVTGHPGQNKFKLCQEVS
jgi:hypothetical protein